MKKLSKTRQLALERAQRKQQRLALAAKRASDLHAAREEAQRLTSSLLPSFNDWGVTKLRGYLKLMAISKHKAELKTIKAPRLQGYLDKLKAHESWTLEYCNNLAQIPDTAVDVSCTH